MRAISVNEAKTGLSRLLRDVGEGKEFLITNRGKPAAKLSPARFARKRNPRDVIQDIRNLRTAKSCRDIGLDEVKSAVNAGRA